MRVKLAWTDLLVAFDKLSRTHWNAALVKLAPVVLMSILAGCTSTPPVERSATSSARISHGSMVDVADLAQNLALAYREPGDGFIELRRHPDNILFLHESRNARVNGELVRMDLPCMRRGTGYMLSSDDAALVTRTLNRARAGRDDEKPPERWIPPRAEPTVLPAAWQPRGPSRPWRAIVIHHMASGTGSAQVIHRIHRQKGWDGIGYHFVIGNGTLTRDGLVEVGYRWTNQSVGAHCKAPRQGDPNWWNRNSIGICLIGDFTQSEPTARQMASLRRLVRTLMDTYQISASQVVPHGGVKVTACPGPKFGWDAFQRSIR